MPTETQSAVGAAEIYDAAVDRLVRYHPDVIELTGTLLEQHPDHAMGHALATYLSLMSTEAPDLPAARETAAALAATAADAREAAVDGSVEAVQEAVRTAASVLDAERMSIDVAWSGTRGDPVTVSLVYEVPMASPLAGWMLPESVTLRSSATMRQEFA